jgi:signal transduction histidine kinase
MVGRLKAYLVAVAATGFVLLALLAATVEPDRLRAELPVVVILSAFVVGARFLSIPLSRDGRGPTVHVDAPFAFALMLVAGIGSAAVVLAVSCVVYDLARRKPLRKLAFNVGAHTIGIALGAGVWMAAGGGQPLSAALPAVLAGTAVFVASKVLLVAIALKLDQATGPALSPGRLLRHGIVITVMAQAVVVVIVLTSHRMVVLLLALGVPTVAIYLMLRSEARAILDRDEAEQTARREVALRGKEHELRVQQQEVARKLQETDQMKDDLLAMVSHELRTPLTTVVGTLRLLSNGAPLSLEERQEMLEMADRQARRLGVLIEQLLMAAQSDRGQASYPSTAVELVEADAAEVLAEAATEARAGRCDDRIQVRCDGDLPVRLAPDAVLQILGNLLDNACKYSPDDRPVWLVGERQAAIAVLAVEDDGAGVPPEEREHIFERFTRLGAGRGLGLGLYIARQLARAQGGELVLAQARHAGGARFELRLPLRETAGSAVAARKR